MSDSAENTGHDEDYVASDESPEIALASNTLGMRQRIALGMKLKHETRFGILALLSFLILVGVFVANKWRDKGGTASDTGKPAPIAAINTAPLAAVTETESEPASVPTREPSASEPSRGQSPPAPAPAPVADATPAVAVEKTPAAKEPMQLAMAESTDIPLPAPAPSPSPTDPKEMDKDKDKGMPPVPLPPPVTPAEETSKAGDNAPAPVPVEPNPAPVANSNPVPSVSPPPQSPNRAPEPTPPASTPAPLNPPTSAEPKPLETAPPANTATAVEPPVVSTPTLKPAEPPTPPATSATSEPATQPQPAPSLAPPAPVPAPASTDLPILTPAPSVETSPTVASTKEEPRPTTPKANEFIPLPTAGAIRPLDEFERSNLDPISPAARSRAETPPEREPSPVRTVTQPSQRAGASVTPRAGDDDAKVERVEAVPHVVQRGENFWTISRLYYSSGRFWKALWAANKGTVPVPERLYVGQTIRIPPPEELDRTLIERERPTSNSGTTKNRTNPTLKVTSALDTNERDKKPVEREITLPARDPFTRNNAGDSGDNLDLESSPRPRPRRTLYKVRSHETLRSIARDTLGDSRRADEILEINAKLIDDPTHLVTGQILELPEDAKLGVSPADRATRRSRP